MVDLSIAMSFLMGKLTISMAIFNSFLYVHQAGYISQAADETFPKTSSAPWGTSALSASNFSQEISFSLSHLQGFHGLVNGWVGGFLTTLSGWYNPR